MLKYFVSAKRRDSMPGPAGSESDACTETRSALVELGVGQSLVRACG